MFVTKLFHYEKKKIKNKMFRSTGETAQVNRNSCISNSSDIVLSKDEGRDQAGNIGRTMKKKS
jgi:hypothetical protein